MFRVLLVAALLLNATLAYLTYQDLQAKLVPRWREPVLRVGAHWFIALYNALPCLRWSGAVRIKSSRTPLHPYCRFAIYRCCSS